MLINKDVKAGLLRTTPSCLGKMTHCLPYGGEPIKQFRKQVLPRTGFELTDTSTVSIIQDEIEREAENIQRYREAFQKSSLFSTSAPTLRHLTECYSCS